MIIVTLRQVISTYCEKTYKDRIDDELKQLCNQELKKNNLLSESLDELLVEVLYYEQKYSKNN